MKIKILILLSFVFLVFLFVFFDISQKNIFKTISCEKELNLILNKSFVSVRRSITQGKFEEEISQINHATALEKQWVDKKVYLQNPLSKNRYWEFDGTLLAKIKVEAYDSPLEMKHIVSIGSSTIKIDTSLESPIKEVGLTELNQRIHFGPKGSQTDCSINITMTAKRLIPFFMENYARTKMEQEAENYLDRIATAIKNLPEPRPGFVIPIE